METSGFMTTTTVMQIFFRIYNAALEKMFWFSFSMFHAAICILHANFIFPMARVEKRVENWEPLGNLSAGADLDDSMLSTRPD